jgi:hypothetical protein
MATGKKLDVQKLDNQITALIAGFTTAPPAGLTAMGVMGKSYVISDLLTKLGTYQALLQAVLKGENAVAVAQNALAPVGAELTQFVQQTRKSIKGTLGDQSASLPAFGLKPAKVPAPLTVAQEQAKVAKMQATRAARHTMGAKQKALIKGQVPAPATAPAVATAPAAQPQQTAAKAST